MPHAFVLGHAPFGAKHTMTSAHMHQMPDGRDIWQEKGISTHISAGRSKAPSPLLLISKSRPTSKVFRGASLVYDAGLPRWWGGGAEGGVAQDAGTHSPWQRERNGTRTQGAQEWVLSETGWRIIPPPPKVGITPRPPPPKVGITPHPRVFIPIFWGDKTPFWGIKRP